MKILRFLNDNYEAEKIIKNDTNIIGKDANGNEVFVFRGISDFSVFSLEEGQTFDTEDPSEQEVLNAQLLKENADVKTQLADQEELTSQLLLQVAQLKGGITNV